MSDPWCILTTRTGADIDQPTDAQLAQALADVWSAQDPEHPNAWLRLGQDDGPLFVLDVYGSRKIVFEQWADADFDKPLAPPVTLIDVPREIALQLWQALRRGDVDAVRRSVSELG